MRIAHRASRLPWLTSCAMQHDESDVAISADLVDPRRVNIIEVWRDSDALDGWRAVANGPEMDVDLIENNVKRYNAEDGGPLF